VLQREETVKGQLCDWCARSEDTEDAAGFPHDFLTSLFCHLGRCRHAVTLPGMIDLHTHSTCSDGSDPPEQVVELAAAASCTAVALTDHDGLAGIEAAGKRAAELGIDFVPGCEVSCKFSPGTLHMLCYFVEPGEGPLQEQLERLRVDRDNRNERLIARLNELGIPITYEMLREQSAEAALGRPHFARVLAEMGVVESYQDAFNTLLAKGGPAYISKAFIDAPTTIAAATGSGALAVLAHPLQMGLEPAELGRHVGELAEAGLTGMECWYGKYSDEERQGLVDMAKRHGLVATGGSDYHGTYKPDLSVGTGKGDLHVPDGALDDLSGRRR
jgi:predicted metal-dependent phosphoesterase TrpH